jgi:pimeloyl-ACP methyl ester carboxylesterase
MSEPTSFQKEPLLSVTGQSHLTNLEGPFVLQRLGCPLHYWITGAQQGPWLVFCHGARMDHRVFEDQVPALAGHYRMLMIDMRGHGLSRPMGSAGFSVELAAADVLAIMEQIGISQAVLIGHSMGGVIAQLVAKDHPEQVKGLVLVGAYPLSVGLPPYSGPVRAGLQKLADITPDGAMRYLLGRGAGIQPRTRHSADRAARMMPEDDFRLLFSALLDAARPASPVPLSMPILLLQADRDFLGWLLLRAASRYAAFKHTQCRYELIRKAAHNMMQDDPQHVNRLLLEFLHQLRTD